MLIEDGLEGVRSICMTLALLSWDLNLANRYYLCSCAVHYTVADPTDKSLFDRFRDIEVCVSDTIVKTVTISLDGLDPVTIEGEMAKLHIEEANKHLKLFVPQDRRNRELCFVTVLPDRLAAYLGIREREAVKVLGDLLNGSASILDDILEEYGVVPLPWTEPASHQYLEIDEEHMNEARPGLTPRQPSGSRENTPERGRDTFQRTDNVTPRAGSRIDSSYGRQTDSSYARSTFTPATPSFTGSLNTPRSSLTPAPIPVRLQEAPVQTLPNLQYIALLNYVIAAAAAHVLQTLGLSPLTEQLEPTQLPDTAFGQRSENPVAHDIKIGAAGELYVCDQKA